MKKILLCVTGSISAYKAASIASGLQKCNYEVEAMMTKAGEQIIPATTIAAVLHKKVWTDADWFVETQSVPHIHFSSEADVILVCPATANTIAKITNGIADNLVTATVLAALGKGKHIIVAPAMNTYMLAAKTTKNNLVKLEELGIDIIMPKEGLLACGDEGIGHLKSTREVIGEMTDLIKKRGN